MADAPRREHVRALLLECLGGAPRLEEVEVPAPGPGEVRVRMLAAGICHTDLAAPRDAYAAPIVLGHEGCGEVEAVGDGVDSLTVGDRVALSIKTACGRCRQCVSARPALCAHGLDLHPGRTRWRGEPIPGLLSLGCFSDLVVVSAQAAVAIDADLPVEQAALVRCGIATGVGSVLNCARPQPGAVVAVWGVGGVGLNAVAGARIAEAGTIAAVDPEPSHLELAAARGATMLLQPDEAVDALTAIGGVDVAIEAVGREDAFLAALESLAVGGELVVLGGIPVDSRVLVTPRTMLRKQARVTGCIYGWIDPQKDLPRFARWCADGTIPVDDLVTRTIGLEELPAVFTEERYPGVRTVVRFD
jgi:S-(hydroxymethyl)glutathione dehydrogenase/alcohol dehydrogenase